MNQQIDLIPKFVPTGRLQELISHPQAELIAYTRQGFLAETCKLRKFNSRAALRAFCKDGSTMHALVKDKVESQNFLTNRNLQTC